MPCEREKKLILRSLGRGWLEMHERELRAIGSPGMDDQEAMIWEEHINQIMAENRAHRKRIRAAATPPSSSSENRRND